MSDIYIALAREMFGVENPTPRQRLAAKTQMYWRLYRAEYHHSSLTTIAVRPESCLDVSRYGHHRSVGDGKLRYWTFEQESGRDLFERDHVEHVRRKR